MTSQITINKYKHILWDYNGTLLDDLQYCIEIINRMLAERNLQVLTTDTYRRHFDFPVRNYYEAIGFSFKKESFEKVGTDFIQRYNAKADTLILKKTAREILELFQKKGLQQYIITARNEANMAAEIKRLRIEHFFDALAGLSDNYADGKTERAKELLKSVKANPKECLLIGDTTHDAKVAEALGTDCILLSDGHHPSEKLEKCGYPIFDNLTALYDSLLISS